MSPRLPASAWDQRSPQLAPSPLTTSSHLAPESPLIVGILPENLRCLGGGQGVGVELWRQWPGMLAGLRAFGEVLAISCSACAVLGKYLHYPLLTVDRVHGIAGDLDGEFDFQLAAWDQARALHLRTPNGHQYGVEFRGLDGETLHKVCLTSESRFEDFLEWVQIHQATRPEDTFSWTPFPAGEPHPRDTAQTIGPEESCVADPALLGDWLRAAAAQDLPIRALVGNDGVVQGHCFVPRSVRQQGPWLFCSSDEVGLHLDPAKVEQLMLHNIATQGPPCWTLKAYGSDGCLSLALAPTAPSHRSAWSEVTRHIFPAFQS